MLKKILGFVSHARAFKNNVLTVMEALDRLDDDLDGDGKSELENIKTDLTHLALESLAWLRLEFEEISGWAKLQLGELQKIADRAKRLVEHVKGE